MPAPTTGAHGAEPAAGPALADAGATAPLIAFDTSTEALAVAVQSDRGALTHDGAGAAAASHELIPKVEALLARAGLRFGDVRAIAFGRGPGAFTGLRTSCAVAQGLAFGAGLPVLPIDSLLVVAEAVRADAAEADVDVAMDARMGEVYAAAYRWDGRRWSVRRAPALFTLDALHAAWQVQPPQVVAGTAVEAFGDRLRAGAARRLPNPTGRAAALLRLAQHAWRDGAVVDPADALPLYLRDKVALTVAERAVP
jgi:tRNA threonylcarbamoyladenosine biosynthesis protein TsaB